MAATDKRRDLYAQAAAEAEKAQAAENKKKALNLRKTLLIGIPIAVLVVAAVGGGIWWYLASQPPNPAEAEQIEVTRFIASEHFTDMEPEAQYAYYLQCDTAGKLRFWADKDQLDKEVIQAAATNVRSLQLRQAMEKINKYFDLPPEHQMNYLDLVVRHRFGERYLARLKRAYPELDPLGSGTAEFYADLPPLDEETRRRILLFQEDYEARKAQGIDPR
jgi:flagellar basal body-associated protein FliL